MNVKKQILVIDDDVDLNFSLTEFLRDVGYLVESVTDPTKVENVINTGGYDVILLDLKMPNISGTEFIKLIKEKMPASKLIVMSGRPFIKEFLARLGLDSYVDGILDKPFGVDGLLEKIETTV